MHCDVVHITKTSRLPHSRLQWRFRDKGLSMPFAHIRTTSPMRQCAIRSRQSSVSAKIFCQLSRKGRCDDQDGHVIRPNGQRSWPGG